MAITPNSDGTIEALLIYLKEYLNDKAIAWADANSEQPLEVVADIKPFQTTLETVQQLPLLTCYRTNLETPDGAQPLSHAIARLDYFVMYDTQNRGTQDALFTWMGRQIALALEAYNEGDSECLRIKMDTLEAQITYALIRGAAGPLTIPFLRVRFGFEDYELLEP